MTEIDSDVFYKEVGSRIEQARMNKRIKRPQMSELTGIDLKRLQRLERGIIPTTMLDAVILARALGIDPASFFPKVDTKQPEPVKERPDLIYYNARYHGRTYLSTEDLSEERKIELVADLMLLLHRKGVLEQEDIDGLLPSHVRTEQGASD